MEFNGQIKSVGSDGIITIQAHGGDMRKLKINQIITVETPEIKRTLKQNALYWVFIKWVLFYYRVSDASWNEKSMHAHFGRKFLLFHVVLFSGQAAEVIRSTTDLSITEFIEYMENIMLTAAEDVGAPVDIFRQNAEYKAWIKLNKGDK